MVSSPRSGLVRAVALFLLLAGGTLSSVEFVLHCANSRAEFAHQVETVGTCGAVHACLGTAMSGASITPVFDSRQLVFHSGDLLPRVAAPASRLAFTPSPQPSSRAPPSILV